jgi:uncharacterized protein involved in exopolysaccharide biosynthesis
MVRRQRSDFTLRDVSRALFRHKKKAAAFFVLVMALTASISVVTPREYLSTGILYLRLGRENVMLDPTVTLSPETVVALPPSREAEINSVAEILASRAVVETMVDAIGPEVILGADAEPTAVVSRDREAAASELAERLKRVVESARGWVSRLSSSAGLTARERAILKVFKGLYVEPVRKSDLVSVSYRATSPQLAQAVVAKMLELYLEQHVHVNRADGAYDFLAAETTRLHDALLRSEQALVTLKNKTRLTSPSDQQRLLLERIARLEDDLLQTRTTTAVSEARVQRMKELLAGLSPTEVAQRTSGVTNQGTDEMRAQLYALKLKEVAAAAKYTEEHPLLKEARAQSAAAQQALDREEKTRTEITTAPGRGYEQVQLARLAEEPTLTSSQAQAAKIEAQLAEAHRDLGLLNENQLQIAALQREVELNEANYRKYAVNTEQARIDRELEKQRISNIRVVQPATLEARPISPRVTLNLLFGLLAGGLGALGLALVAEYLDHSFKTPEDVESQLELPILASIPRLQRRQLVLNGKH